MKQDLHVVAVLIAEPAKAVELRAPLLPAVEAFRQQQGFWAYALHEDIEYPGGPVSREDWRERFG